MAGPRGLALRVSHWPGVALPPSAAGARAARGGLRSLGPLGRCWAPAARLASLGEEAPGGLVSGCATSLTQLDMGSAAQCTPPAVTRASAALSVCFFLCAGVGGVQRQPEATPAFLRSTSQTQSPGSDCPRLPPGAPVHSPFTCPARRDPGRPGAGDLQAQPWGLGHEDRGLEAGPCRA